MTIALGKTKGLPEEFWAHLDLIKYSTITGSHLILNCKINLKPRHKHTKHERLKEKIEKV